MIPKRTAAERMVSDQVVLGDENADPDLAEHMRVSRSRS